MLIIAERHIKPALLLFLILHLFIPDTDAQLFSDSDESLITTVNSAVNWIDFDMDGNLDMSVSGEDYETSGLAQGIVYLFNSSHEIYDNMNIRPISTGDQSWSDFNNDGLPDLLYAGGTGTTYEASAGIDTFDVSLDYHTKFSGFLPVATGLVDWGDFDNDGDYDVFICGSDASGSVIANLYRNDNGVFTDVNAGLPGVINGKVGFIDYDLDQDLDIFITGKDINENKYACLWKNTNGVFTITNDVFLNVRYSQYDWGDINSDGYPDLILGGYDDSGERNLLYINNSGNGFSLSDIEVPDVQRGTTCLRDADNDGDLDALMSGYKPGTGLNNKFIFYNNGTDFMGYDSYITDPLYYSNAQFGDYDNDNDLDFVMNGLNDDGLTFTILVNNSCGTANTPPSVPENLSAVVEGTSVTLTWDNSTDNSTPQESITYNIYVGVTGNKNKIVSPIADLSTGFRRISRPGYIRDNVWTIKDLPVGTYYWGVQAIDNSLAASVFSDESTFEIKDRFTKESSTITPNQTSPAVYFDCDHDNDLDLFLNHSNTSLSIIENTLTPFSQANYRTVSSGGYYPINTLTPNDYNNNNLIDFSISGDYDYTANLLRDSTITLYRYNEPFSYNVVYDTLAKNINVEYVLWADLNNDGKQDLITSGKTTNLGTENKPVTYIYKNLGGGTFQKVTHNIQGFEKTGAVAGDFDNDMDVDIIIYGKDTVGTPNTYVYINEGDFNFTEEIIPGNELFRDYLIYGIQTGDFDLDGYLDVYMAGTTLLSDRYARVLLNNSMNFSDANLQIRSSPMMSNFWADYDYDGDLDIFSSSSYNLPDNKVRLYHNNNGVLDEIVIDLAASHQLNLPFMAVNLDNDNGLDFVMKIEAGNYNQYYDNWGSDNRINTAPSNTQFEQDQLDIILKWNKLSDCPACTYNIRVGTLPDGVDIMSPMSDITTGYRYVVQPGNAYLNDSWKLCDLPVGKYYWSVQAVDPANTGGPWAPEDSFTVSLIDADFSFTVECRGDTSEFTDLSVSTETITGWKWNFGDGGSSTLQNPKYVYTSAGTFTAGLWAYSVSGDSAYQEYDVLVKAVPDADFTADIACLGTSTNFTNNTDPNGTTILTWLWNFGDGEVSTLEDPGTNGYINAGNYDVNLVVTADNGCVDYITKTITVSSYPVTLITADAPLTFCKGDSVTLSVPYNSNYNYNWMAEGTSLTGGDTSKYIVRLTGNYNAEVINPIGDCRDTSSIVTITANVAPVAPLISASGDLEFCQGDSVILSATNTAGYTYQWKLNGGAVGTDTCIYVAKAAGIYSLTISNTTGCSADATNTVTVTVNPRPSLPVVNISGSTTFCNGDSVVLDVTNNPSYTYQWQNNSTAIAGAATNKYIARTTGVYSLKITNSYGCNVETEDYSVTTLAAPSAPLISAVGDLEFCQGDSVILSVTNTSGYSYQWKLNGGAVGSDSNQLIAKAAGTYSLTVSNSSGCSADATNTIAVNVNPKPSLPVVNISGATTFCQGDSVVMDVTNNPAFSYQWQNNSTAITGAVTNKYIVHNTGVYSLKITNSSGCNVETEDYVINTLIAPSKPLISAGGDIEFCLGDSVMLSVTNTSGYSYQWKLNGGSVGTDSYSMVAKNPGEYNLVVTNSNLCSAVSSNSVNVVVNQLPAAETVNLSGSSTFCEGGSVTLSVSSSAGYIYHWRNENGFIPDATATNYTTGTEGIYQLEITNTYGCTSRTLPVNVTVKPIPYKPLVKSDNYQPGECMGETPLRLDADQVVPEYSYQWYRNGIPIPGETSSTLEDFLTEGDYFLKADLNGCTAESDVINVFFEDAPDKPSLSAQGPTVWYLTCSIRDTSLYKYRWYCNGKLITGANNYYYIAGRKMGDYQVSIGNSLGCYTISNVLSIPSGDVGIDDIDPFEGLKIYPNPSTGLFTIEMDNNLFRELMIRVISENGKEVLSLNLDKATEHFLYEVDLSGQPPGLYIINLLIDRYLATRKVIVE